MCSVKNGNSLVAPCGSTDCCDLGDGAACTSEAAPEPTTKPTPAPTGGLTPEPNLAAGEACETSDQCQASLFCNGDPKCEACYYPGDLEKDEAGCARYVEACCEHGLSGDAALCVCAGSDGNNNNGNDASLAIIIPVVIAAVLLLAAILFLVRKRVVAARQHRRESMPTVGGDEAEAEA